MLVCTLATFLFNSAKDEHNRGVQQRIEEEISLNNENTYAKVLIESEF